MSEFRIEGSGRSYFICVGYARIEGPFTSYEIADEGKDRLERLARLKERACITCRTPFMSEGAHNRMCRYCRKATSEAVAV